MGRSAQDDPAAAAGQAPQAAPERRPSVVLRPRRPEARLVGDDAFRELRPALRHAPHPVLRQFWRRERRSGRPRCVHRRALPARLLAARGADHRRQPSTRQTACSSFSAPFSRPTCSRDSLALDGMRSGPTRCVAAPSLAPCGHVGHETDARLYVPVHAAPSVVDFQPRHGFRRHHHHRPGPRWRPHQELGRRAAAEGVSRRPVPQPDRALEPAQPAVQDRPGVPAGPLEPDPALARLLRLLRRPVPRGIWPDKAGVAGEPVRRPRPVSSTAPAADPHPTRVRLQLRELPRLRLLAHPALGLHERRGLELVHARPHRLVAALHAERRLVPPVRLRLDRGRLRPLHRVERPVDVPPGQRGASTRSRALRRCRR